MLCAGGQVICAGGHLCRRLSNTHLLCLPPTCIDESTAPLTTLQPLCHAPSQ